MYKGMLSPLAGVAAINAIVFGVYGNMMKALQPKCDLPKITNSFVSGAVAGGLQTFIACPMELIKLRLQVQKDPTLLFGRLESSATKKVYLDPMDAIRKIHKKDGFFRGLNKGFVVTLWREIPAFGAYFATYDFLCLRMKKKEMTMDDLGPLSLCLAGGVSGIAAWVITYPFDVVKSRVQIDGMLGDVKYQGTWDCFVKSYNSDGIRVFSKGLNSTIIRAFPVNAVTFTTVAFILRYWRNGPVQAE